MFQVLLGRQKEEIGGRYITVMPTARSLAFQAAYKNVNFLLFKLASLARGHLMTLIWCPFSLLQQILELGDLGITGVSVTCHDTCIFGLRVSSLSNQT